MHHRAGQPRTNRVLYIAVEGESTEPDYLDYLNKEFGADLDFVIHSLWSRNGLKPHEVVEKALEHRGEGELWALFDRDEHPDVIEAFGAAKLTTARLPSARPGAAMPGTAARSSGTHRPICGSCLSR